jgi:plasmid stabilization system protein ParE
VKVILSPDALADLQEIGDFIGQDNLDAAASFVALLRPAAVIH